VLLNYAEAQNEASGPDATVIDAIDRIRMRAGIPSLATTFGSLSQDEMRTVIRRERRVELTFEDKRYWDLLRWKLAEDKLKGFMHAMEIVQDAAGDLTY
jgi:starch-binding outer membrane protein, SusD/RagB family